MTAMTYSETLDFLYNRLQAFHRVGATAYKPGLHTTLALSALFGNPHVGLPCIHVAGTNGKGSTAHLLASVLQSAGYKVGLYTSPHLRDFGERIRVDGRPMEHERVVDFTERFLAMPEYRRGEVDPSFFELATVMAFEQFRREHVDIAVIEVGLGGRLDSTNIITPLVSVITNISPDHTALLGDTPEAIAAEKAGIIKAGIPAVIGEAKGGVRAVFRAKANSAGAPIIFAGDNPAFEQAETTCVGNIYIGTPYGDISCPLTGVYQQYNANTVLHVLPLLDGYTITDSAVADGFAHVVDRTGLLGRWTVADRHPTVIYDTGHNPGAWQYIGPRLQAICDAGKGTVHIILGFVNDKDITHILDRLPHNARYYFVQPDTPRAAAAAAVAAVAAANGIHGPVSGNVADGWTLARSCAGPDDTIFVGGSNFVVADFLNSVYPLPVTSTTQA